MRDERIIQMRNKILGELAVIMYLFVVTAFVVKVIFMGKKLEDCVVEYAILILAPIYQYVRARQLKISLSRAGIQDKKKRYKKRAVSLAAGALVFGVCYWRTGSDIKEVVPAVITFLITFQMAKAGMEKLEQRRAQRLEKEYGDGEE